MAGRAPTSSLPTLDMLSKATSDADKSARKLGIFVSFRLVVDAILWVLNGMEVIGLQAAARIDPCGARRLRPPFGFHHWKPLLPAHGHLARGQGHVAHGRARILQPGFSSLHPLRTPAPAAAPPETGVHVGSVLAGE
tara:strand:- start:257 stop:667 length:411 start_codon:yes stop_codon:yes gene_type:complete